MVTEFEILTDLCPECGGGTLIFLERGEEVCKKCGLVVNEQVLDNSHSGVRAYNKSEKDKKERTGSPISILMPDMSLTTILDTKKIKNQNLKRAAKWNTHLSWEKRNMLIAITELKRIGSNLNFPERVKKAAVYLYKEVFKKNLLRGRSIGGMITACAYYVCKQERVPITLQEILDEASMQDNVVKKCYKILIKELKLKNHCIDPISLIPKYCSDLNLDISLEIIILKILHQYIKKSDTCGKDPKGLCAGAIYLVTKIKNAGITQKQISNTVGVTEVTLRSRYKEFLQIISFSF